MSKQIVNAQKAPAPGARHRGQWAFASLALSASLSAVGTSIVNVGLPAIAEAFTAPFHQVQWILLAYLLAMTTLIVSIGRMGDVAGRRRLLLGGILLFTAASGVCTAATTLWLLIAARAAQGLGAAAMMALSVAFVADTVPKDKTGSAMGVLGTASAIGTALGPSLAGVLIAGFGWRAIFLVNLPLGMLAFLLAYRALPHDRPAPRTAAFDYLGALLLALTLAAYALAMTAAPFGLLNFALLVAAGSAALLFGIRQLKAPSPLVRLTMLRDPVLTAGLAMSTLVMTVMMTTLVVGPFYLSQALGLDGAVTGLAMAVGPIVAALAGVPGGRIADRLGGARVLIAGLLGMGVGCSFLATTPVGVIGYVASLAIITAGYALFQAANNSMVMIGAEPRERGAVSGLLSLSRNLGLITGASAMGAVFALGSGTTRLAAAPAVSIANGMHLSYAIAAGLVVAALSCAFISRGSA